MWPTCVPDGCVLILASSFCLSQLQKFSDSEFTFQELQESSLFLLHPNVPYPVFDPAVKKRSTVLLKHPLTNYTVDLTKASPWKHLCLLIQTLFQACSKIHPHPQTPDTGQFWPLVVFRDEALQVPPQESLLFLESLSSQSGPPTALILLPCIILLLLPVETPQLLR